MIMENYDPDMKIKKVLGVPVGSYEEQEKIFFELGRIGKEFSQGFIEDFLNNLILLLEEKNLINDINNSELDDEKISKY